MKENKQSLASGNYLTGLWLKRPLLLVSWDINMKVAGLIKQSLVDYPGEVAAVLFLRGCNMACPFCHNGHLMPVGKEDNNDISQDEITEFLAERQGFLDGVVFSGGEPTLRPELPEFITRIKNLGYLTKLDTNGTNPAMLQELLEKELVDYVAMDIKAPLEYKKYLPASGGRLSSQNFMNIRSSLQLLLRQQKVKVEFRTTVVPSLHGMQEVVDMARNIEGAPLYSLQQFTPQKTWDTEALHLDTYAMNVLLDMAEPCKEYVQRVRVLAP
jgi:pyruvate formate lyase activating enzyme